MATNEYLPSIDVGVDVLGSRNGSTTTLLSPGGIVCRGDSPGCKCQLVGLSSIHAASSQNSRWLDLVRHDFSGGCRNYNGDKIALIFK